MSIVRAVGRNTIIQFGGKVIGTVLGLITIGLLQDYLDPAGFGAYTTAMAYLGFLSVLADLGLYMMLIRELAKPGVDEKKVIGNLLGLRWVSAAVILGVGAVIVTFFPYSAEVKRAVFVGTLSFVAIAATQLLVGIFQTKLAMARVVGAELFGRVVLLLATFWAISSDLGVVGTILAVVAGSLANLALVWWSAGRYVPLSVQFDFAYWRQILRETWPIAISIVLNLIYFRIDTIFLSLFSSEYNVGLYGAAYKVLEILNTFPIMFVGLLLPVLGRAFATQDKERFRAVFQRGFELLCMAAIPLVLGGWVVAEQVLVAIGNESYAPAAPALRLLLIAVGALFLNALSGHVVTVINRQRQMVWTYLGVAALGVTAYAILIPRFGIQGAAMGTILTESATAIVGFILVLRVMQIRLQVGGIPRIILAAIMMSVTLWFFEGLNIWLLLLLGSAVYLIFLMITGALRPATMKEILARDPGALPPQL